MTTTDHVRIIAEAMGWDTEPGCTYDGTDFVVIFQPSGDALETFRVNDLIVFTAHAVAWAAGKGIHVCYDVDEDGEREVYIYRRGLNRWPDPTDPHAVARATLAAIAEVVGMMEDE